MTWKRCILRIALILVYSVLWLWGNFYHLLKIGQFPSFCLQLGVLYFWCHSRLLFALTVKISDYFIVVCDGLTTKTLSPFLGTENQSFPVRKFRFHSPGCLATHAVELQWTISHVTPLHTATQLPFSLRETSLSNWYMVKCYKFNVFQCIHSRREVRPIRSWQTRLQSWREKMLSSESSLFPSSLCSQYGSDRIGRSEVSRACSVVNPPPAPQAQYHIRLGVPCPYPGLPSVTTFHHCWVYLEFLGELVGDNGSEAWEQWRQKHTDVTDVNCYVEEVHTVIEGRWGDHQTCKSHTEQLWAILVLFLLFLLGIVMG